MTKAQHLRAAVKTRMLAKAKQKAPPKVYKRKNSPLGDGGKLPTVSANELTTQMLKLLDLKGYQCWRQNNVGVYDPHKQIYRANSTKKGIADILGYHRKTGRFCAIEIKVGKDKLTSEQTEFLQGVANAGGLSLVVKTVDDLENFVKYY